MNFALFTKANPPPALEAAKAAALAELRVSAAAARDEEQLQAEIAKIERELDAMDDNESDERVAQIVWHEADGSLRRGYVPEGTLSR